MRATCPAKSSLDQRRKSCPAAAPVAYTRSPGAASPPACAASPRTRLGVRVLPAGVVPVVHVKRSGTTWSGLKPWEKSEESQWSAGGQVSQPSEVYSSTRAVVCGPVYAEHAVRRHRRRPRMRGRQRRVGAGVSCSCYVAREAFFLTSRQCKSVDWALRPREPSLQRDHQMDGDRFRHRASR